MLIVVDTGGTKTLVASFGKNGVLQAQHKFPTPHDPDEYIRELKRVLQENYSDKEVDAITVGTPGVIKNGVVIWGGGNLDNWRNFKVRDKLKGVLGDAPVFLENDAKLAALGEAKSLSATPKQVLYVTISTGIGSGMVVDGKLTDALSDSEAGHALIEYDGAVREWETFASGKAILKAYGQYAHDITSKAIWKQIADRISRGFLAIVPILQPDVIIIGGSIGTYFDKYGEQLQKILFEKLPSHIPCPKFVAAKHPELAVIYGCYYYAVDKLADKKAL